MIKIHHTDDVMMYYFYNSITKQDINILREEIKCLLNKTDEWIDGYLYGRQWRINRKNTNYIYSIPKKGLKYEKKSRIDSFIDPLERLKYGKYKGRRIGEIYTIDRDYYEWWRKQEIKNKKK